jgi:hypothetical protein
MKFRTVMAAAAAVAALSFAAAGPATARTLGHESQHKPAAQRQITGSRLAGGLLRASAFGSDFTSLSSGNTGGRLSSTRVRQTPGSLSCGSFANYTYDTNWGNTAGARVSYWNPNWSAAWPNTQYSLGQVVLQFATVHAASTFFNEAYAKYAACRSFDVPNPSDTSPGGGSYQVSNTSTSKTTVSGHRAFVSSELWALAEASGYTEYVEDLYVVSGTDVYDLWYVSGTNDEPSPALMSKLIHRVQALYR